MAARAYGRREVLALAAGLPATLVARGRAAAQPMADVVIAGGDPAGYALAHALVSGGRARVTLVDDTPAFAAYVQRRGAPGRPAADVEPFVRGHRLCFEQWRDRGLPGWGYEDVLPVFKRQERHQAGGNEIRGGDGPFAANYCLDPNAAHRAFLVACAMSGYRSDARYDFNGPAPQGVAGFYQKTLVEDREQTPMAAFLDPVRDDPRLTLVPAAQVLRVALDGTRATGLEVRHGMTREVVGGGEVVVAAGAVRSAQLLLAAGIGPPDDLGARGRPVVAPLPGVGENLHEQVRAAVRWHTPSPLPASTVTAGMFTVSLAAAPPDLQLDFAVSATPRPVIGMDVRLVRPASRGRVRLAMADPLATPLVDTRRLADAADVTALVLGLRLARLIVTAGGLDRFRGEETTDTARRESAADLDAYVRSRARGLGELAGSCRMGPDDDAMAVVDAALRVRGTRNLRVAGTAVMPAMVNAPPTAAAAMTGGRCADLLRP